MANAATSALRLHQRLPPVTLTREFLALLLLEDSCHYLFFSLIFLYVSPMVLILFPVVLFAVLHSASYSLTLLDVSISNEVHVQPAKSDSNVRIMCERFFVCLCCRAWARTRGGALVC